eukprot:s2244_g16.t2
MVAPWSQHGGNHAKLEWLSEHGSRSEQAKECDKHTGWRYAACTFLEKYPDSKSWTVFHHHGKRCGGCAELPALSCRRGLLPGLKDQEIPKREFHAQHELERRGAEVDAQPGFAFAQSLTQLDLADQKGRTLLHHAAEGHAAKALQALLKARSVDFKKSHHLLRARDAAGQTVLAYARDNESVALLLEARAEFTDKAGCCPGALLAASMLCLDSNFLRGLPGDAGGSDALAIHHAAHCGAPALEALLARGFAVDHRDPQGRTPLHLARDGLGARVLLDAKATVDEVDSDGSTALHLAVTRRSGAPVVEALLNARATVEIRNKEGLLPLDIALPAVAPMLSAASQSSAASALAVAADATVHRERKVASAEGISQVRTSISHYQHLSLIGGAGALLVWDQGLGFFCCYTLRDAKWILDPKLDQNGMPQGGSMRLLDPCAKCLDSRYAKDWNKRDGPRYSPMAVIPDRRAIYDFDWQGVKPPGKHLKDLVIYETHVRGMTRNPDSKLDDWDQTAGTFLGFIQKIPHLLEMGINAVELLPVYERNPENGEQLCHFWGYSTVNFFVPMQRFSSRDRIGAAIVGFKTMVRELHRRGIEVILDVVFNHTAEGAWGEHFWHSWAAIAKHRYYILNNGHDTNYTGCGNTVNANDPMCSDWIVECLCYWVEEMHVDGFRFDLASALTRGNDGKVSMDPLLMRKMANEPKLKRAKFIAEAWDCSWPDGYLVGKFPSGGPPRWAEWNGIFRDTIRCFIKGDAGKKGDFATRICGSSDLFKHNGRKPYHSINFITAHDGFTLKDLVSYNGKHNTCNGENSGDDHNNSWNCGHEGETGDGGIKHLRNRQIRNFMVALFMSAGTPMSEILVLVSPILLPFLQELRFQPEGRPPLRMDAPSPVAPPDTQVQAPKSAAVKENALKMASLVHQSDESELLPASVDKLQEWNQRYITLMGSPPEDEEEATDSQLSALHKRIVILGQSRLCAAVPLGDGSYITKELSGPQNLTQWMACWRVFKVAALALGIISLSALQQYEKVVEKLTLQWPQAWGLIVLADDKARAERLEKIRRSILADQQAGRVVPLEWDAQSPWSVCFKMLAKDGPFWSEQVRHPAAAWMASGSTSRCIGSRCPMEGEELDRDPDEINIVQEENSAGSKHITVGRTGLGQKLGEAATLENPPRSESGQACPAWLLPKLQSFLKDYQAVGAKFNTCIFMSGKYRSLPGRLQGLEELPGKCNCPSWVWVVHEALIGRDKTSAVGEDLQTECAAGVLAVPAAYATSAVGVCFLVIKEGMAGRALAGHASQTGQNVKEAA